VISLRDGLPAAMFEFAKRVRIDHGRTAGEE
jgi:hypothetical protein